jgi:hypothetical protein
LATRRGFPVAGETVEPADHNLHRAPVDLGALDLSADGHAALSRPLLRGSDPFVQDVRSACVAACATAAHAAGDATAAINAAPFRILRADARFVAPAVPAIPALTSWF